MRLDFTRIATRASVVKGPRRAILFLVGLALIFSPLARTAFSQSLPPASTDSNSTDTDVLRMERMQVQGGAELVTILARLSGLETNENQKWVPLVSVLRDTLGDGDAENDRLRYVWPLTYTRPSLKQKALGAVPFFYGRLGNNGACSDKAPPPAMDLSAPENEVWNKIFWTALQNILLDPWGMPIKLSTRSYRRNIGDYRRSHIIRALSVLSLYQAMKGERAFSPTEMAEINSRLNLTDKTFGGLVDDLNLQRYSEKTAFQEKDYRGHNWELLRQRAEAESLYFEPFQMPDGTTTHALLWVAKQDLANKQGHPYSSRFLNISDPWSDKRLQDWKGYVETRYFDSDGRPVSPDTPGARPLDMIPLALYGLDNPKIPMLLVDFRDGFNPKKREMSRRVLQDVTRDVLSISRFGNLPYFLGRTVFDFVTGRRGIDINQPSRLKTYSQLKLLLALNDSLDPELREQISGRLERVSLNPLENDFDVEARVAAEQYEALLAFAKRPDGLTAKLERDRRAEMVKLDHGRTEQVLFRIANVMTFGKYVHREDVTSDMTARLDARRRLDYHTKFLQQVARSNFQIDVAWDLDAIRKSLSYIADHGDEAGSSAVLAASKIFTRTRDDQTRRACLESLVRIASPKARNELIRISQNKDLEPTWKDTVDSYITQVNQPPSPATANSAKTETGRFVQQ